MLQRVFQKQFNLSARGSLSALRWLIFLSLSLLVFYSRANQLSFHGIAVPTGLLVLYGISNIILGSVRRGQPLASWLTGILFIVDTLLVGGVLFGSVGLDADLYLICFLIIYLSTLGKTIRQAFPLSVIASILYAIMTLHQNPDLYWYDPKLLLRFPFFFVLTFFTTYLSEESEKNREKVIELEQSKTVLQSERDYAFSELDKKQAALIQAEKLSAMGNMAGALAHEIRNPLAVIMGYAEELLTEFVETDPHHKILGSIDRCAKRCNHLVENLLRFSRQPKTAEEFSISEVIRESFELARLVQKQLNIKVVYDFQGERPVLGHRSEMQQVFINLSTNAIDAMADGGTLTFRTRIDHGPDGDWTVAQVEDTGSGMSEDVREHMFEFFYTTKPVGKGTGLGLPIVRDILQNHKSIIQVSSQPGHGTTFILRFPVSGGLKIAVAA